MGYRLGVDLGTTYTAAAVLHDRPEIISLGNHSADVPSVLFLHEDGTFLVGEAAERRGALAPQRLAREFKRRIGDKPLLLAGTPFSAHLLTGKLLRWVADRVAEREGGAPEAVVVTHPANWGPYKKEMLQQAVASADLPGAPDVRLATEPECAALRYANLNRLDPGEIVAVYDLGGGTFDTAILSRTREGFEVLGSPAGIEQLGGVDFDDAILSYVAADLGVDVEELDQEDQSTRIGLARLRRECVSAKEALSQDTEVLVSVALPQHHTVVRVTRAEFEDLIRPTVAETVHAVRRALSAAEVEAQDLSAVLLAGGSSRIPLVTEMLSAELGRPVAVNAHPKHLVAMGAALLAAPPAQAKGRSSGRRSSGSTRVGAKERVLALTGSRSGGTRSRQPLFPWRSSPASSPVDSTAPYPSDGPARPESTAPSRRGSPEAPERSDTGDAPAPAVGGEHEGAGDRERSPAGSPATSPTTVQRVTGQSHRALGSVRRPRAGATGRRGPGDALRTPRVAAGLGAVLTVAAATTLFLVTRPDTTPVPPPPAEPECPGLAVSSGAEVLPGSSSHTSDQRVQVSTNGVLTWLPRAQGGHQAVAFGQDHPCYAFNYGRWAHAETAGGGQPDLVRVSSDGVDTWQSSGDGSYELLPSESGDGSYPFDAGVWRHGDATADGRADLLHIRDEGVSTWISNGDGSWAVTPPQALDPGDAYSDGQWVVEDLNADGADDLLHATSDGLRFWTARGDGTYTTSGPLTADGLPDYDYSRGWWRVGDVAGDSQPDLVHVQEQAVVTWVAGADGSYSQVPSAPGGYDRYLTGGWFVADATGDGKGDLLHSYWDGINVWTSSGTGAYSPITRFRLPDYGGDRISWSLGARTADASPRIILVWDGGVDTWTYDGSGFERVSSVEPSHEYKRGIWL